MRRLWWLLLFLPLLLASPARVDGNSMNPTLRTGQPLLLARYPHWLYSAGLVPLPYQRGDLVVFKAPVDSGYAWQSLNILGLEWRYRPYNIKRVIGLPGDTVSLRGGAVWLNGRRLAEPYASGDAAQDAPPAHVPASKLYVLGDNRQLGESVDSRFYGVVSASDVAGTANLSLWPLGRAAH